MFIFIAAAFKEDSLNNQRISLFPKNGNSVIAITCI